MQSKTQHRVTLATLQALSSPMRLFPSSQKVPSDRLIQTPASVTHHRQTRRIAGTLRRSDREGHLTPTESAESLPDVQGIQIHRGEEKALERVTGDAFVPRHLPLPTGSPPGDPNSGGEPMAVT